MAAFQNFWFYLYSTYDPFVLDCLFPFFAILIAYTLFNIPFLTIDIYGCPKALLKYKVQPNLNVPVSVTKIKKVIGTLVFNLVVVGFATAYCFYHLRRWRGCVIGPELPTALEFIKDIAICALVEEFGFYYSHRFLHTSLMYKKIHKKHHEWNAPISIIAQYCHPFEHFLSNAFPIYLGPFIAGSHTITAITWNVITMYVTCCHHSGYKFPLIPSPTFHDYHHEKFTTNFGVLGFLDEFHGTSGRNQYIASKLKRKQK